MPDRVDVHTHAFSPKIVERVVQQLQDHYHIQPKGSGTLEDLQSRLKSAGIDRAIVHSAATRAAQVMPANNWAIHVEKHAEHFTAFGTIHPEFEDWEQELNRLQKYGIRGLKLHADMQGFRLDDERLWHIFEEIEHRFMVMFHVGDRVPPEKNPSSPQKVARIKYDFPNLTIIAAHFGGFQHWEYVVDAYKNSDIFIDTSSSLQEIPQNVLEQIVSVLPRERILFGSNYPLFDPGEEMKHLQRRLNLSDSELDELLCNGSHLLNA